jgi:hypothetical protein
MINLQKLKLMFLQNIKNYPLDLAPKKVFNAFFVAKKAVSSYPTFSPLPFAYTKGGTLSVALSLRLP